MKKISLVFLVCSLTSMHSSIAQNIYNLTNNRATNENQYNIINKDVDLDLFDNGFDIDALLGDQEFNNFLDKNECYELSSSFDPVGVLEILVQQLNILAIAQEDFYLYTYPPNKRNIVDNAAFYPFIEPKRKRLIGIQPFYNETSRMRFTKNSDCLRSYVNICGESLLAEISKSIDQIKELFPDFDIDPLVLFPLFGVMTTQDRQLGIMVHGDKFFRKYHLHVHVPFLYRERNFYMTEGERRDIEQVLGPSTGDESDTHFQEQHLICDKLGIGDTRITFERPVYKFQKMTIYGGVLATIPTAYAFQTGFMGSSFENRKCDCSFSLPELWDQADQGNTEAATKVGTDLLLSALDRLAFVLLDTGLGLDGHFGLGAYFHTKALLSSYISKSWARRVTYRGRTSLEYHFPATENRLFKQYINPADYTEENFETDDPDVALSDLYFLSNRFIQKVCPFKIPAWVHPGVTFRWISSVAYQSGRWSIAYVSDFWFKGWESVEIKKCNSRFLNSLNIKAGERPYALQSTLGAYFSYTREEPTYAWTVGLYAGAPYWVEGIGNDFTLALNITGHF